MTDENLYLYVSSWAEHGGVPGLGLYKMNQENGEITFLEMISECVSFNGSCISETKKKLYVNNEVPHVDGVEEETGRIFVYDLDPMNGHAEECQRILTGCSNPAYVSLDSEEHYLFEAHHAASGSTLASVQTYELDENGIPSKLLDSKNHAEYEKGMEAHPHSAVLSPSGRLIAVADKGTGYLYLYRFDHEGRQLVLLNKILTDRKGASPRYVLFHPKKPYLFVNHEASYDGKCYVSSFRYGEDGFLERLDLINVLDQTLPVKTNTRLEQQGFVMTEDGNYLYTLINAADVIAVIKTEEETGKLQVIQNIEIPGIRPRGLAITPNGKYVISTCLVGGELTSFQVEEDGRLKLSFEGPIQKGASYISFYKPVIERGDYSNG